METKEHELSADAVVSSTGQTQLGEGIRWDARRDEMLAVDILAGRVARARVLDDGALERIRVYQLPEDGRDDRARGGGRRLAARRRARLRVPGGSTAASGRSPRCHRPEPG